MQKNSYSIKLQHASRNYSIQKRQQIPNTQNISSTQKTTPAKMCLLNKLHNYNNHQYRITIKLHKQFNVLHGVTRYCDKLE